MKKFMFGILYTLVIITFLSAVAGVVAYTATINQNAFSLCELVVCAYCAVSVLMKAILVKRTKVLNKNEDNEHTETNSDNNSEVKDSDNSEVK